MEYNMITNTISFMNNGTIDIVMEFNDDKPSDLVKFLHYATGELEEIYRSTGSHLDEMEEGPREFYTKYLINKYNNSKTALNTSEQDEYNEVENRNTSIPDTTSTEYEKLIRAIDNNKAIYIYSNSSSNSVDTMNNLSPTSLGKDVEIESWLKTVEKNEQEIKKDDNESPNTVVIIKNKPPVLPPSLSGDNLDINDKQNVYVLKALAKKYPMYPEHYEQIKNSSAEATKEAIWLQQQDNSLEGDRPSEEKFDSYNLEELYGEKEYSNKSYRNPPSSFVPSGKRRLSTMI
jgi:hypothetical protein